MELSDGTIMAYYCKSDLSELAKAAGSLVRELTFCIKDGEEHVFGAIHYEAEDHDEIWPEGEGQTKRYVVRGTDIILQMRDRETFFRPMKEREKKTLQRAKETIGW